MIDWLIDWLMIDFNVVMPIYNLIEYSKNYSKTTESLQNYYRDEPDSKQNVKIIVPLKHLSNFWKTCDIPFISCEIRLVLTWSENCVLTSKSTRSANYENEFVVYRIDDPANATFQITDTKLHVPVVTLLTEDDNKLLKRLKKGM